MGEPRRVARTSERAGVEAEDMAAICAPVDFLGLNYYCPYYVGLGDWDDLRLGESPQPGHPGVVSYVPPQLPRTNMGWIVEPEGLYDTLRALDREAPRLPLYITENGCAAADYVTPERTRSPGRARMPGRMAPGMSSAARPVIRLLPPAPALIG